MKKMEKYTAIPARIIKNILYVQRYFRTTYMKEAERIDTKKVKTILKTGN